MRKNHLDNTSLGFSGSYHAEDVVFLLKKMDIQPTDVQEKERLIQSGQMHYSQMISLEKAPTKQHWSCFNQAMHLGAMRMAHDIQALANRLKQRFKDQPIVLISLVRAGVPLGVLLKKCISQSQTCFHYGISIIRDRGIDFAALEHIIQKHGLQSIVFVDGWTGKGAISQELQQSLQSYPELFEPNDPLPRLVTLTDLGGCAWLSASAEDWLIPSGILGSVVSGLISRSILIEDISIEVAKANPNQPDYWHGCIEYRHLETHDISNQFVDEIWKFIQNHPTQAISEWSLTKRQTQHQQCQKTIAYIAERYSITNINRIKPSIAEATRAVLRRVPERILLQNPNDEDTQLLRHFAQTHNVPIEVLGQNIAPYKAITIIKKMSGS